MSKELILRLIPKLNESELDEVIATIGLSKLKSDLIKLHKEVQEARYSNGHFECPVCHGTHVQVNELKNYLHGLSKHQVFKRRSIEL